MVSGRTAHEVLAPGYYRRTIETFPVSGPMRPMEFIDRLSAEAVTVSCYDAYDIRGRLKGRGYRFVGRGQSSTEPHWLRTIPKSEAVAEQDWLQSVGCMIRNATGGNGWCYARVDRGTFGRCGSRHRLCCVWIVHRTPRSPPCGHSVAYAVGLGLADACAIAAAGIRRIPRLPASTSAQWF
jgi:hypothetical protein